MAGSPYPRIGDRVAAAVRRDLVGRDEELARLTAATRPDSPCAVVFVHGAAGLGKTTLLRALPSVLDLPVIALDGRDVEPTPDGVVTALAAQLDCTPTIEGVADALAERGPAVLAIDALERLPLVDAWLRHRLLPALPATVTTVAAGRDGPNAAWRTAPGWRELLMDLPLGPLDDDAATELLRRRGLTGDDTAHVRRFARGVPLALELAAAAVATRPGLRLEPGPDVVGPLVEVLLDGLDASSVDAVEAAAAVRRATEPLLAAVLPAGVDARAAWDGLARSPLAEPTATGLVVSELVRDVVVQSVQARDPDRLVALRRAAAAHLAPRVRGPAPSWADTADLLHLIANSVVRHAFFPPGGVDHPVEPASTIDHDAIRAIGAVHLGPAERVLLDRWLDRQRADVVVSRGEGGSVAAFGCLVERSRLDPAIVRQDPVAQEWLAHLRRHPVAGDDVVLLIRWTIAGATGEGTSPELAPLWVEAKRHYLRHRRRLRRVYASTPDWAEIEPAIGPLGFAPTGPPVDLGDDRRAAIVLDFGPDGVDGWLGRVVDAELSAPAPAPTPDEVVDDRLDPLSGREREVLALLAEGLTNHELAARLFISERTVNRHVSSVFAKLGVSSRAAAARIAAEAGLTS